MDSDMNRAIKESLLHCQKSHESWRCISIKAGTLWAMEAKKLFHSSLDIKQEVSNFSISSLVSHWLNGLIMSLIVRSPILQKLAELNTANIFRYV